MGCWFAPSLVEVVIGVCSLLCEVELGGLYPSSVEVIVVVWLRAYPSIVRRCLREEFGTPIVVTNPPRWRFPRWKIVDWKSFTVVKAGM